MPEPQAPRRNCKDPMLPEDPAYQDYTEEGNDQGYFETDYFPTAVDLEIERLKQLLAEKDRQLDEAWKTQAGKPKKKSQSTRRNETEVTKTATVQTEAQTCTGPLMRQAARAAGDTLTQATSVQVPREPR